MNQCKDIEDMKLDVDYGRSLLFSTCEKNDKNPCSVILRDDRNMTGTILCNPSAHDLRLLSEWARKSAEFMEASE